MRQWHAIRVTYGRELKFQTVLNDAGFETFVPMTVRKIDAGGKKIMKIVPAVSNLCFVYASKDEIKSQFDSYGDACPARFMWDKSTQEPIVIPLKAMQDFILISNAMLEDTIYLNEINTKLKSGSTVRISDGPFKGVEGKVVRIKKSRRVMVELPGMMAVATTYIPSELLEPIHE